MGETRNRGLIVGLLGIVALFVLTLLAYRLPPPIEHASPSAFSAYRARAQLEDLVGSGVAHPIGSSANARVRDVILRRLTELGYDTEVQSGFVCNEAASCGVPSNIIALRHLDGSATGGSATDGSATGGSATGGSATGGSATGGEAPGQVSLRSRVLLAAHYDSVPAGPGASDDAAGVATVLEIAQILKSTPTRHPIALLFSDGEEAGLLGARLFAQHPLAETIGAAVNLDARGTSGASLMFETGSANTWAMELYRRVIARPITDSIFYVAYKTLHNDTDFSIFKSAGRQGFNFAYIGDIARYHTALDTIANADLRSIQHQGDNALASVRALADSETLLAPPEDAVFFDVLARAVVEWRASSSVFAALAILACLSAEITLLLRHRRLTIQQFSWGALGAIGCLFTAGTASIAILELLLQAGAVPPLTHYSWIAHPAWMGLVCAALAAGGAGVCGTVLSSRAGFWGFWASSAMLIILGAALQAAYIPGTCFILLITAGVAVVAVIPHLRAMLAGKPDSAWLMDISALAPAFVLLALAMPPVSLLYGAIGSVAWPIDTLLLSMGTALLLPLLSAAGGPSRLRIVALSAGLGLAGVLITLMLPVYSVASPQRLNFAYEVDQDASRAYWVAQPDSMKLPAAVAAAASFERKPTLASNGGLRGFRATAPFKELPGPRLTLREATREAQGMTRYDLHLQSWRNASDIDVSFSGSANVRDVLFNDASGERHWPLVTQRSGATRLHLVGMSEAGLDFAVIARGASLKASVSDRAFSLPAGEFLQRLRGDLAVSAQEGDTTVIRRTVVLNSQL